MLWSCGGDWWFITFKTVEPMRRINFQWIIHDITCLYALESYTIDKYNFKKKKREILKLCFSQQYPPFPCEVFYKPNLAAVYAAEDVYSLLCSGSLSNYWSSSLKLSGDWLKLKCIDHPSLHVPLLPTAVSGLISADRPLFETPGSGRPVMVKCSHQGLLN